MGKIKKIMVLGLVFFILFASCNRSSDQKHYKISTENKIVAIVVPVTIAAIESFVNQAKKTLESSSVKVFHFSAEGDAGRFESVIKAALMKKPDVLIIFGTQLTNTAFGPQFNNYLPKIIASGISSPDKVEALERVGINPPRNFPVSIISDTPKLDIYSRSAEVISQLLNKKQKVAGILYNESEINSKVTSSLLKDALEKNRINVHLGVVTSSNDVIDVAKVLIMKGCKILAIPHDKYVLPKARAISKLCFEAVPNEPMPVFSLDDGVVRDSEVAIAVSVSFKELGEMTAKTCLEILMGKDPAKIPVLSQDRPVIYVNKSALEKAKNYSLGKIMNDAIIVDAK